jgi:hypothetical protein
MSKVDNGSEAGECVAYEGDRLSSPLFDQRKHETRGVFASSSMTVLSSIRSSKHHCSSLPSPCCTFTVFKVKFEIYNNGKFCVQK